MAYNGALSWVPYRPDSLITCYIYNLITDERIEFVVIPEGVTETYSAEWTTQDILGRSAPYLAFVGNPARTVEYSIQLDRDILGDPVYENTIDSCKRLVYPNYTAGGIVVPPYSYIRFGGIIKMFAVVESVSVSWSGTIISNSDDTPGGGYQGNTSPNDNLYSQCELSFSFTEIRTRNQLLPTAKNLNVITYSPKADDEDSGIVSTDPPIISPDQNDISMVGSTVDPSSYLLINTLQASLGSSPSVKSSFDKALSKIMSGINSSR